MSGAPAAKTTVTVPMHPRFVGIDATVRSVILPWLAVCEKRRRAKLRWMWVGGIAVLIVASLIGAIAVRPSLGGLGYLPPLILTAFYLWRAADFARGMADGLTGSIMQMICEAAQLEYSTDPQRLPLDLFQKCDLLRDPGSPKSSDEWHVHCCAGSEANISFVGAQVRTLHTDGDGGRQWSGIMLAVQAPRQFKGMTLIRHKPMIGRIFAKPNRVTLGLPHLENRIEIHSSDVSEAIETLDESFLQRLLGFAAEIGIEIPSVAFFEDRILATLPTPKARLGSVSIWTRYDDPVRVHLVLRHLAQVLDMATLLAHAAKPGRSPKPPATAETSHL